MSTFWIQCRYAERSRFAEEEERFIKESDGVGLDGFGSEG